MDDTHKNPYDFSMIFDGSEPNLRSDCLTDLAVENLIKRNPEKIFFYLLFCRKSKAGIASF